MTNSGGDALKHNNEINQLSMDQYGISAKGILLCVYIRVDMHAYIHVCILACVYTYVCVYVRVCVCTCVYTSVCICVCVCG